MAACRAELEQMRLSEYYNTFSYPSNARRCIASASSYLPWLDNTDPSWLTLVSVSGCSGPSTFSDPFESRRCIASASSYLPCLDNTDPSWLTLVSVFGCSGPSTFSDPFFQISSVHLFRLFVLALPRQHRPKLADTGERVWVL